MKITGDYPLHWPAQRSRTAKPRAGRGTASLADARDGLLRELERWKGLTKVMLSTNLPLRQDGLPKATGAAPKDAGAVLYFQLDGLDCVLTCDRFTHVADNLSGLRKALFALRELYAGGVMTAVQISVVLRFARTQYRQAEPEPDARRSSPPPPRPEAKRSCWAVLGLSTQATVAQINAAFRQLSKVCHPDKPGGSTAAFQELTAAREMALKLKGTKR